MKPLQAEKTLAETDFAIAQEAARTTNPNAEQTFQRMVERDTNLLPGQGKGWREVYKSGIVGEAKHLLQINEQLSPLEAEFRKYKCAG